MPNTAMPCSIDLARAMPSDPASSSRSITANKANNLDPPSRKSREDDLDRHMLSASLNVT